MMYGFFVLSYVMIRGRRWAFLTSWRVYAYEYREGWGSGKFYQTLFSLTNAIVQLLV